MSECEHRGHGARKRVLELAKRTVDLEHVTECHKATHLTIIADAIFGETVNRTHALSAAVDSE